MLFPFDSTIKRYWLTIPLQLTFPFQIDYLIVQPLAIRFIETRP